MIHAVLIFNTTGTSRLTKFYLPPSSLTPAQKAALPAQIFHLVSARPSSLCCFLDAPSLSTTWEPDTRIVYRCYATLFFVFVVDSSESELGILDLIQVFVESLDRAFENVCELDLVFHFDQVHHILAEIIQGGLVLETNVDEIASAVSESRKARKESYSAANPLSLAGSTGGMGQRGANSISTPLGWLAGKVSGLTSG
ncbi:hypothetical protein BS47DRAFT_1006191 [Hydnum rufescens UP504]|uniref:AP complex mu/sigma subunit domain-containing protein n=1 Tax=Hydnum rufescens UP504 TaxID=1448309 RepID=A0A9P6E2A0_9AGAM|nr:hypothetical protein BS47DRAFT_1006191 [Hydnum rufescens UP504]